MAKCFQGNPVYRQFVGARSGNFTARTLNADAAARDIFYTGPTPSADPNDRTNYGNNLCNAVCGNICSGICGECGFDTCVGANPSVFAFYADSGALNLCPGGVFPLDDSVYSIGPIGKNAGCATIGQAGRYLAVWTLSGISQQNIDTRLTLMQNGSAIGSVRAVAAQGDTLALIGQALFDAQPGDVLQLVSTAALSVSGMPAASLMLTRVC